jgi:hypothetical protein
LVRRFRPGKADKIAFAMGADQPSDPEYMWLAQEIPKHPGKWIAICRGRVVAEAATREEAHAAAKAQDPWGPEPDMYHGPPERYSAADDPGMAEITFVATVRAQSQSPDAAPPRRFHPIYSASPRGAISARNFVDDPSAIRACRLALATTRSETRIAYVGTSRSVDFTAFAETSVPTMLGP